MIKSWIVSLVALIALSVGYERQPSMIPPRMALNEAACIGTLGGTFTPLVSCGVELPSSFADEFLTGADNQAAVQLTFEAGTSTNLPEDALERRLKNMDDVG